MNPTTVVDTNVWIDYLRGDAASAMAIERLGAAGSLAMSAITVFELNRGARSEKKRQAIRDLLAACSNVLPLTEVAAEAAARIEIAQRDLGKQLEARDALIAGTVVAYDAELLTRDSDFRRVPELSGRLIGIEK
ncbi:MAG: type II toxin-antitoxin system VapC family toxin [Bryobacteraceae bacterium]|nr:type II toxin-antitoxin system VapC family toxin [Bryobacteraceae bacterium]